MVLCGNLALNDVIVVPMGEKKPSKLYAIRKHVQSIF